MRLVLASLLLLAAWPTAAQPVTSAPGGSGRDAAPQVGSNLSAEIAIASSADVFNRLLALLQAIPKRWETIPPPFVPVSLHSIEDVLGTASATQRQDAAQRIERLVSISPADRPATIQAELHGGPLSEIDVWEPLELVELQQARNLEDAGETLEAYLQWAEALGRKDALQEAAAAAISILQLQVGYPATLPVASIWASLQGSARPERERGRAEILVALGNALGGERALEAYDKARQIFVAIGNRLGQANAWQGQAETLYRLGEGQKALDAFRTARQLFITEVDQGGQGNTWKGEADVLLLLSDNQGALAAYRTARQLFFAVGDQLGQGNAWEGEARVLFYLAENQKALDAYRSARQLFLAVHDRRGQASTWRGEGNVLLLVGEKEKALEAYRNAHQLFLAVNDQLGLSNTWYDEGDILFRLAENQKALDAYRSARQISTAIGYQLGEANSWRGEADVLFRLGESQKALDAYSRARQLHAAVGDRHGQANTWMGEAEVRFHLGEYQQALDAYSNARQLFTAIGSQLGQGNTWRGEAQVLSGLGENLKAFNAYKTALQLFVDAGDQLGQANIWLLEAELLFRFGEIQLATDAYDNAYKLFAADGDQIGQGNTWNGLAKVQISLGDYQQALESYRNARRIFVAAGDQLGEGNTWMGEARVLRTSGAWRESARAAAMAATSFHAMGSISNQVSALILQTEAEEGAGDQATAAWSAAQAIDLHAQWRKTWITDRLRTAQEADISAAYDFLVPFRARQPDQVSEALRLAEEARSRVLLDLMAAAPSRGGNIPPAALVAEHQNLETVNWEIEQQLRGTPEPLLERELRTRRLQLDRDLEWNAYQRIAAQKESLAVAQPLSASDIQDLTRDTGPLLLYYTAPHEIWAFLVRPAPSTTIVRSISISREELGGVVRDLARDLANPLYEPRATSSAHRLWDLLIAPFSDHIPEGGRLVIAPHGPLHELPFEALLDPAGRRLFEHWLTSVTPSASVMASTSRRHLPPSPTDSFIAFSSGLGLILPPSEVAAISRLFATNNSPLHPIEALYPNYEQLGASARHLFIATRGVHSEGSRSDTYLEIEPTPEVHDSRLSSTEIATIPLRAELVTLAACDTSHGHALLSDERLDLARSFLIAGAAAILASRWKVPEDTATSRFLFDFYRVYRRGGEHGTSMRKDEALNEARRLSRERGDPAQVWAAWVLVGDAR